jgi:hypothetical protein
MTDPVEIKFQVPDWDKWFESAKSRTYEQCSRVYMPNKQHGMGFTYIMSQPDGASIYGIWCLIVGALAQQRKPREGWLTHNGYHTDTGWTPQDLALRWRRPISEVERALEVLTSPQVAWLKAHQYPRSIPVVSAQYRQDSDLDLDKTQQQSNRPMSEIFARAKHPKNDLIVDDGDCSLVEKYLGALGVNNPKRKTLAATLVSPAEVLSAACSMNAEKVASVPAVLIRSLEDGQGFSDTVEPGKFASWCSSGCVQSVAGREVLGRRITYNGDGIYIDGTKYGVVQVRDIKFNEPGDNLMARLVRAKGKA